MIWALASRAARGLREMAARHIRRTATLQKSARSPGREWVSGTADPRASRAGPEGADGTPPPPCP